MSDRVLSEVLEQIIRIIPCGEESFIATLKDIQSSTVCCAPEGMYLFWQEAAEAFDYHLPEDLNVFKEWQKEIIEIWMDEKWLNLL